MLTVFALPSGAQMVSIGVREGERIGLYADHPPGKRKQPKVRGLGTSRHDEAVVIRTMLETALDAIGRNPDALTWLQKLLRDQKITFPAALGLWLDAQRAVGRNATAQLDHLLAVESRIYLRPLIAKWGGGNASVGQRARNLAKVEQLIPADMTTDQFTPRFVDACLQRLLTTRTTWSNGKPMTKRTMLKYRVALNLYGKWLTSPAAANAAGLSADRYVLMVNPVSLAQDQKITQQKGDRRQWKKNRVWHTQPEAKAIVDALTGETRAVAALFYGSCLEYAGAYNTDRKKGPFGPVLFKRNFLRADDGSYTGWFHVQGLVNRGDPMAEELKTEDRSRDLEIPDAEGFDYYRRIVFAYLDTLRESDPFMSHHPKYYKRRYLAALAALDIPRPHGRLWHVCRHSFAQFWKPLVMMSRADGRDLVWLKQQAGHAEDSMVLFLEYTADTRRKGVGEQVVDETLSRQQRGLHLVRTA